jgi:hypothetical protein
MGSNFDTMAPDLGVVVEEKGRTKRGNGNYSALMGKYSLSDYNAKFSRTSLQFSQTMTSMMKV